SAQVGFSRTAQTLNRRHIGFDQPPLCIGKVACITSTSSLILRTSDFVVLLGLFGTIMLSQLTEITQFISGQPLSLEGAFEDLSGTFAGRSRALIAVPVWTRRTWM